MNVHPQTATYRALNFVFKDAFRINALSNAAQDGEAQFLFSATLAQTFNNRSSRIDWCGNYCSSQPTDFHSSRRSGSIFGTFLL